MRCALRQSRQATAAPNGLTPSPLQTSIQCLASRRCPPIRSRPPVKLVAGARAGLGARRGLRPQCANDARAEGAHRLRAGTDARRALDGFSGIRLRRNKRACTAQITKRQEQAFGCTQAGPLALRKAGLLGTYSISLRAYSIVSACAPDGSPGPVMNSRWSSRSHSQQGSWPLCPPPPRGVDTHGVQAQFYEAGSSGGSGSWGRARAVAWMAGPALRLCRPMAAAPSPGPGTAQIKQTSQPQLAGARARTPSPAAETTGSASPKATLPPKNWKVSGGSGQQRVPGCLLRCWAQGRARGRQPLRGHAIVMLSTAVTPSCAATPCHAPCCRHTTYSQSSRRLFSQPPNAPR
jgi:hypothetical protein